MKDPAAEVACFQDTKVKYGHLSEQVGWHKQKYENVKKDGIDMIEVTKTDTLWKEAHTEWKDRCTSISYRLKALELCRGILEDKFEELMEMRMVKIPVQGA